MALLVVHSGFAEMKWHWNARPSDYRDQISESMDRCVASWNTYADYDYDIGVSYSSGTPTADAGYMGQIRFGGQRNYRVAIHESCHWMGTGTVREWSEYYRFGKWTGTYAYNLRCALDGPGERQSGDHMHFWPYGGNFDSEGVQEPQFIGLVGAYRRDMGLDGGDRTIGVVSGTYRLRNRQSVLMLDNLEGAKVVQGPNRADTGQCWKVNLIEGTRYFTIQNEGSGKYLDSGGRSMSGSPVRLTSLVGNAPADSQLWEIVATDSFFFRIASKVSGNVLDNHNSDEAGAEVIQSKSGADRGQQWTFVHSLVQWTPSAGVISHGRPATSSSAEDTNHEWKANNGVLEDHWTASSGSYPQWWRVDLGVVQPITQVAIHWFEGENEDKPRSYRYRIEVSDDDKTYTTAADCTSNTTSGLTVDKLTANARYVRVTVTGASSGWAAIRECLVFNENAGLRLLSQFRPPTASSEQSGHLAVNATDVDAVFTRWTADSGSYPQWWQVDLGSPQRIGKAVIEWYEAGKRSYQYRIEGSTNGSSFTTLLDRTDNESSDTSVDTFSGTARYVRITVTGCSEKGHAAFYDAQVFGSPASRSASGL